MVHLFGNAKKEIPLSSMTNEQLSEHLGRLEEKRDTSWWRKDSTSFSLNLAVGLGTFSVGMLALGAVCTTALAATPTLAAWVFCGGTLGMAGVWADRIMMREAMGVVLNQFQRPLDKQISKATCETERRNKVAYEQRMKDLGINMAPDERDPKIGLKMEDGTIYAGVSPDTGKPFYTMPEDVPRIMTFNTAAKYAKRLFAHGHHDWRLPSEKELCILRANRTVGALGGTFNQSAFPAPAGRYWVAGDSHYSSDAMRFCSGDTRYTRNYIPSAARLVR